MVLLAGRYGERGVHQWQELKLALDGSFREIEANRRAVGFGLSRWMVMNLNDDARVVRELDARAFGREIAARSRSPATQNVGRADARATETCITGPGVSGVERRRLAVRVSVSDDVVNDLRVPRFDAHRANPAIAAQTRCRHAEAAVHIALRRRRVIDVRLRNEIGSAERPA